MSCPRKFGALGPGSPDREIRLKAELARQELDLWVRRYGFNSTSYVLLEGPKSYFTSPKVDGCIAYQRTAGVAVVGGDPLCSLGDTRDLLSDFLNAIKHRGVAAYNVSPRMLPAFREAGFRDIQIGKEAIFDLRRFTLQGGEMELVRAAVNKAWREGIVVAEHDPFEREATKTNDELHEVSEEWLKSKGEYELGFLLGSLGLERPSAKRYFVARSGYGKGRIEGFIVCEPIYGRNGYYLDVTRRRTNAVRGTMEVLTTEIFRILREEGYEMASMGLAPLALLDDDDLNEHPRLVRLMRYLYERSNIGYDFKSLFRYKTKFHPHSWEPRYLCFNRTRLSMRIIFAVIQVRKPGCFADIVNLRRKEMKATDGMFESWRQAASFVVGLCAAILSSPS